MSKVDENGYKIELAMQVGFMPSPREDDVFICTPAEIVALVDRAREQGRRELPDYDRDIADALDAYSKECSGSIGDFTITERMSGTFRWHEAWDRVRAAILQRSAAA